MKQLKNKTAELKKLSEYFLKIEKLVTELGLDMDDLVNEFKNDNMAKFSTLKEKILNKAGHRANTFKNAKNDPSEEEWVEKK